MKQKPLFVLLSLLILVSMILAACQPAAPTESPEPPEPTMAPFDAMVYGTDDCSYGGIMKEIKAVDEYTVQFTLCQPDPAFESKAAFSVFGIQPMEWLESTGGTGELLEKPVGTGPYMLDTWNRGDSIVYKRFDDYWGEKAKTDTLVFRWASEGAQRKLELESGQVDGIDNPSPDDFAAIEANSDLELMRRPALNIFYVGMTRTYPPFDDIRVRQAIGMGLDRQRIVDNFYPAGSEVASHFTPCSIPNACVGEEWYEYDKQAALDLLEAAGLGDGFETTIYYRDVFRGYLPEPGLVATDLQAQLADLGITAKIEVMESGTFIAESSAGNLNGIHLLGWGADYPHITNFMDYHFGASQKQFGAAYPEIYEHLQQGAQIADTATAQQYYEAANNAVREQVPLVPIAHGGSAAAYRADVEGGQASPLTNEVMYVMKPGDRTTFVWMQNAEPISLYCADETDGESLRACEQVVEALLSYEINGTAVEPALATGCTPNADLTVYTCELRQGVKFHDGSSFDANDVVVSWAVQWDAEHPLHTGNTGVFEYWATLWGSLLNPPPAEE
jgi:ABC-type transport system substrate-binding protein